MREINELTRNNDNPIEVKPSIKLNMLLDIFDHMIAGKRFAEVDSATQMYLLSCQGKIDDMKDGQFTQKDVEFLYKSIDGLMAMCVDVRVELDKIFGVKGE